MARFPDYANIRKSKGFTWSVGGSQDALRALTGVSIRDFNLLPEACIEAYQSGRPKLAAMFGPDIVQPPLCTPSISYGHANGLGAELLFPEGGEVGHRPPWATLEEGIRTLRRPVDFRSAGVAPFYREFREKMEKAFPGEAVGLGLKLEGPLTTAWEMRGQGFFTDLYDDPERSGEFLGLITESILEYHRFLCDSHKRPVINPEYAGLSDDIAAMVPPDLWETFVLPFWDQYYRGMTTGERRAHVEDLRPLQLKYLEAAGLSWWDPSVSPKLSPAIIARGCRVPFAWRLPGFQFAGMDSGEVRAFVFSAAAEGANAVFTGIEAVMCDLATAGKIRVFIDAVKEVKARLDAGAPRAELAL